MAGEAKEQNLDKAIDQMFAQHPELEWTTAHLRHEVKAVRAIAPACTPVSILHGIRGVEGALAILLKDLQEKHDDRVLFGAIYGATTREIWKQLEQCGCLAKPGG